MHIKDSVIRAAEAQRSGRWPAVTARRDEPVRVRALPADRQEGPGELPLAAGGLRDERVP